MGVQTTAPLVPAAVASAGAGPPLPAEVVSPSVRMSVFFSD